MGVTVIVNTGTQRPEPPRYARSFRIGGNEAPYSIPLPDKHSMARTRCRSLLASELPGFVGWGPNIYDGALNLPGSRKPGALNFPGGGDDPPGTGDPPSRRYQRRAYLQTRNATSGIPAPPP